MCEYCENNKKLVDGLFYDTIITKDVYYNPIILLDDGETHKQFPINYCPMCGKKLV